MAPLNRRSALFGVAFSVALLVCGSATPGCTTAEGLLLGANDGDVVPAGNAGAPSGADCGQLRQLIASEGVILHDVTSWGGGAAVVFAIDTQIQLLLLDRAGAPRGPAAVLGQSPGMGEPALAAHESRAWLAFQNHSLKGTWRVYVAPLDLDRPEVDWQALWLAGDLGGESLRPTMTANGSEIAVAFRADQSHALSRLADGELIATVQAPAALPLPRVHRVEAHGDGYATLHTREEAVVSRFLADGTLAQEVPLGVPTSDLARAGDTLLAFAATENGAALARFESDSEPSFVELEGASASPSVVGLATFGTVTAVGVADLEGTSLGFATGARFEQVHRLDFPAESLRLVPTDSGVVAVVTRPAALEAILLCP